MAKTPTEIRSLARSHTDAAINALVGIVNQSEAPPAARVAAANAILDRGWGKPVQGVELSGIDGEPINTVTRIELVAPSLNDDSADPASS